MILESFFLNKMASNNFCKVLLVIAVTGILKADEEIRDFDFSNDPEEVMIAQESRQYQTIVKPPVRIIKPNGVTNSHRPQYNIDSFEEDFINEMDTLLEATTRRNLAKDYQAILKMRSKESLVRDAVLRALERKEHVGKFAQLLPIVRAMSGSQRKALASLVASQVSTPPGRTPLNLSQVRSMFGNTNTTDLMLPILLDMANLIRRAVRAGKHPRDVKPNTTHQMQRRSFNEDETYYDDEPFESYEIINKQTPKAFSPPETIDTEISNSKALKVPEFVISKESKIPEFLNSKELKDFNVSSSTVATLQAQRQAFLRNRRLKQRNPPNKAIANITTDKESDRNLTTNIHKTHEIQKRQDDIENIFITDNTTDDKPSPASTPASPSSAIRGKSLSKLDNGTVDLTADSTNQTLAQDLPVAEKLRALSRYIDRKATNPLRRGNYPPKPPATRRTAADAATSPVAIRRRPLPPRKLPAAPAGAEQGKCELFTNTLCLQTEDYPTDAIVQSIRRNKAAAGALLADFKDPGEGAVDGVTAEQEAKYTADHYLTSNRRGDTASRDFASAGEAGFMCPSTVKYARPQRARATSGQWKYIVNTGEHTQTLRLEKCLKPKESCTYLTDNFKSKCVQVYNYHRLLTWDQQNGLHMDIFKVPTCCSCHIEGYSVSFPPLGHRVHETSSEHFPGEDLSSEHGNHAFEAIQSSIQRPTLSKNPPFAHNKPLEAYPPFSDNHNLISGVPFSNPKLTDNDDFGNSNNPLTNPVDSYGKTYFPDNFDQASSSIRNVRRPSSARNPLGSTAMESASLPSYLEPPTPSAPVSFSFSKETPTKHKINQYKRGVPRPSRRPIIKKISSGPEDLMSSGTSAIESLGNSDLETLEDFNDDLDDFDELKTNINATPTKRATIAPKLSTVTENSKKLTKIQESQGSNRPLKENALSNGKKVNYNYHPIIDFFGEGKEEENESIDREDSEPTYTPNSDSEWKPINHPTSRNSQGNSARKQKHK